MIEIKHRFTGKTLHTVEAETLVAAKLRGAGLQSANLREANLRDADLSHTDLSEASLTGASLIGVDLSEAQLHGANLRDTTLRAADLRGTRLSQAALDNAYLKSAQLTWSDLSWASLRNAVLRQANLEFARLQSTDLAGADLSDAVFGNTMLLGLSTLHLASGLESVRFTAPCTIDHFTLTHCLRDLPDSFLEGVGLARSQVEPLRAAYGTRAVRPFACYIHRNETESSFAERLIQDLRANNIPSWRYRSDDIPTRKWQESALRALRGDDKLILVCSRRTIFGGSVVQEIGRALVQQNETGVQRVFPVCLDDHLYSSKLVQEARKHSKYLDWHQTWLPTLRRMEAPSFQGWETDDAHYAQAFRKLLEAIRSGVKNER